MMPEFFEFAGFVTSENTILATFIGDRGTQQSVKVDSTAFDYESFLKRINEE
jgi:hypothetical protein